MAILTLHKYLSINSPDAWRYRRQLITERELYFSDPSNFNDPLDCNIAATARLKAMLHECRVFCLSRENCDDYLMFAHYADGHRGFRLTFQVDTAKTLDEIGVLGHGRNVIYVPELPGDFEPSNIHQSLFMKLDRWKYEAEYRILAVEAHTLSYDDRSLVQVAFGCRMNPDFEPVIRNWVSQGEHLNVKFSRVQLSSRPEGFEYVTAQHTG